MTGWPGKGTKISHWETGERYPGIHDMLKMSKCMSLNPGTAVTIEYIYQGRTGEMPTRIMEQIQRGEGWSGNPLLTANGK